MREKYDLVVIGGGVLGTFHAYHAFKKGLKVALLEKNKQVRGATVQNFGQVVPSGMNSKWQFYGRESLKLYKEIQSQFDISVRQEGTIYLASNNEEVQLLEELAEINKSNDYESQLLTKAACLNRMNDLNESYVKAGLYFPEEVIVEPQLMIHKLQDFMKSKGIDIYMGENVIECTAISDVVNSFTSTGKMFKSSKVIICNGNDFQTLYPTIFDQSDLEIAKLQMMRTKPQGNFKLKGSVLSGLSIRRYESFSECPSYKEIKAKEDPASFEKKRGVHILFKQAFDGSVILGDSHEYTDVATMDKLSLELNMDIDNFIIKESKRIFDLPTYEIQNRWIGMYSQCKSSDIYQKRIDDGIHIVTGIGGKGMTGSAGFAKESIKEIFNY